MGRNGLLIDKIKKKKQKSKGLWLFLMFFVMGFAIGTYTSTESASSEILFSIAYSSEKESWMEEIKEPFISWYEENYGVKIKVNFFPVGSRESIIAILNGQYKPAIWSPAASTWIPYMNYLWKQGGYGEYITSINKSAVYSPIVLAIWESFVNTYNISSLNGIYELTLDNNPPVKLAHTDPRLSNSGFCSIIMEIVAASGKNSSDLVYNDLLNKTIQEWIGQFESVAVHYGKSTGYLIRSMLQTGPIGINTAILYENLIIESAAEAESRYGEKIIAIYPEEGSIHSDHPFCVLDGASWMDDSLLNVSTRFLSFIEQEEILDLATVHGFRVYNENVSLPSSIFNQENGVEYNISAYSKLEVPKDPEFISRVSDLWLMNRPTI